MGAKLKYLTNEEKEQLFKVINKDDSIHAVRNKAIFYVAEYCALRASEIGLFRIDDYDSKLSQIYCKRKKGSKNNTIKIIDNNVKNALDDYLVLRKKMSIKDNCLFISQMGNPISRKMLDFLIKKYCKNTFIPYEKRHFHVLKHTRAVELGNSGLDTKDIQWWLGHTNIENTQIYAQFTTHQQNRLYEKLEKENRNGNKKNKRNL